MAYINLTNYKSFLIQKMKSGFAVRDSKEWGILIKSFPFDIFPEMKEVPKNDWYDENGDDEFVSDTPVFKAFESDIEFLYTGTKDTAIVNITSFMQYLSSNGMNNIYDQYTGIGRTNVRYVSIPDAKLYRNESQGDLVVFKIKLKFNDPTTLITLAL